ncbi:MAG: 30S ribosomal protein S20 [Verrucomicrobia bacterium]|nr:30S ribosomal protein S20 [Verrucomicrobiota bacterium]MBV9671248.1 30S ribosomal protein S20 [Verrucomicrobiota bacterium]
MANTKSAAKRARQTLGRTLRNKSVLTALKRQQKKFASAIASGDKQKSQAELAVLASRLDKAAKRGTVHQNLADRRKSRATKLVNAIQGEQASPQENAVNDLGE